VNDGCRPNVTAELEILFVVGAALDHRPTVRPHKLQINSNALNICKGLMLKFNEDAHTHSLHESCLGRGFAQRVA